MYFKLQDNTNLEGHWIQERIPTLYDGEEPPTVAPKFDRFIGRVGIAVQTPVGQQIEQIEFPIVAKSLQEAFTKFMDSAKGFMNKLQHEARDQKPLVAPGRKSGLILPRGL